MSTTQRSEIAVVVVEVDALFPLHEAERAVAEWLMDRPEVADAAEIVVTHRDATDRVLSGVRERLAEDGPGLLVCGPSATLPESARDVASWDVDVDGPTTLVAVLERIVTSVDLAPGDSALPDPAHLDGATDSAADDRGGKDVPAALLYVATVGRPRRASWWRGDSWRQELVDVVASHAAGRLVRLLALGEGIAAQSALGVAADFASGAPGWSAKQWPAAPGRIDLRQVVADLSRQLRRDVEQAAFEGVQVTSAACVLGVHEPLVGIVHLADEIAALGDRMDLLWAFPDAHGPLLPAALADARTFSAHAELAAEVARALGVGPRRLDARLRGGLPPGQPG